MSTRRTTTGSTNGIRGGGSCGLQDVDDAWHTDELDEQRFAKRQPRLESCIALLAKLRFEGGVDKDVENFSWLFGPSPQNYRNKESK